MSVILLSDRSALRTSDEHRPFDLSSGRRLTPVDFQAIPRKPAPEKPVGSPRVTTRTTPPSGSGTQAPEKPGTKENNGEMPASGYLPGSG